MILEHRQQTVYNFRKFLLDNGLSMDTLFTDEGAYWARVEGVKIVFPLYPNNIFDSVATSKLCGPSSFDTPEDAQFALALKCRGGTLLVGTANDPVEIPEIFPLIDDDADVHISAI